MNLKVEHWHGDFDHQIVKSVAREHALLIPHLKNAVVLDIGAHIGCFTVFALNHGAKKVIAIEPGSPSVKLLRKNIRVAKNRVEVLHAGVVGTKKIDLTDTITLRYLAHGKSMPGAKTMEPTSRRLLAWNGIPFKYETVNAVQFGGLIALFQPKVIKLDCEGAEYDCIESMIGMPKHVKVITVEWHKTSTKTINRYLACIKKLKAWGFKPTKQPKLKLIYDGKKVVGSNQLFIRPIAWVRAS